MKILSRSVEVSKSTDEVNKILRTSAFVFSKSKFAANSFKFYVKRKHQSRGIYPALIPVSGDISSCKGNTKVNMEVHADVSAVLGGILLLIGMIGIVWCYLKYSQWWFSYLGMILVGICIVLIYLGEGKDVLDQLENKLLR